MEPANRGSIYRQSIALIDDPGIIAELLGRTIVVEHAVVFPLNIVEFGIDVGCDLLMTSKFVGQKLEAPAYIAIAIQRAHAAELAVDQRLAFVQKSGHVI